MNTDMTKSAISLNGYIKPAIDVVDMQAEGLFCLSYPYFDGWAEFDEDETGEPA